MNPTNGLRFDVYERVHLPVDVADIHELEQMELAPHIQVVSQGDQVLLRGNLLLGGVYSSLREGTEETRTLEHWIPVEITLPASRVADLDDITVEIENFDVDLLSARTLNITGVLSLRGVEPREVEPAQAYSWGEEPFTVVHRKGKGANVSEESDDEADGYAVPGADAGAPPAGAPLWPGLPGLPPLYAEPPNLPETQPEQEGGAPDYDSPAFWNPPAHGYGQQPGHDHEQPEEEEHGYEAERDGRGQEAEPYAAQAEPQVQDAGASAVDKAPAAADADVEPAPTAAQANGERAGEPDAAADGEQAEAAGGWQVFREPLKEEPAAAPSAVEREDAPAAEAEPAAEALSGEPSEPFAAADEANAFAAEPPSEPERPGQGKGEMKIAFGAKQQEEQPADAAVGLSSLLQSGRREQEIREAEERREEQAQAEAAQPVPEDEVEWKKLFLGKQQEQGEFRKVRMCIVQRDETLESIAGRYQLNPRELVLYNRLADQSVSEGQVLIIP